MTQFSGGANSATFTGTHAEFGTSAGVIAWGRWIGPATVVDGTPVLGFTAGANQGYHYVVGTPTAAMPTTGTATYALLGATNPTYASGSSAPGTFSGSLSVTFGASATVNGNFNVAMADARTYAWTGSATASGATFSMTSTATGTGGACSSSCSAAVQGFFAGATAQRAGISYRVTDTFAGQNLTGAAAFAKQ
jgi:hypothetical protein